MPPLKALIVDDSDDDAQLVARHIRKGGYNLLHVRVDEPEAMAAMLAGEPFDVIICDYSMPRFSGPAALALYKQTGLDIPFIMVSGTIGEEMAVETLKNGAHDFVIKSSLSRLVPAIERELREVAVRRARRQAEDHLRHAAFHDTLTGLPNRVAFQQRLQETLANLQPERQSPAVLLLDLDRFKLIVDSLGHRVGDQLFQETARRLKARVGNRGTVARLTGDNFAILLDHAPGLGEAQQFAEDLQRDFATAFPVAGHEVYTSASIGIVTDLSGYTSADDVLRDADTANHSAKLLGRGNWRRFDATMRDHAVSLYELENKLRGALGNDEFRMFYQPIVRTGDETLAGFEALVRWRAPGTQAISPSEFVPVSEDMGLIIPLGRWVLQESCRQMQSWLARHPDGAGLKISVNLSARQFAQPDLLAQIDAALEQSGLPARCLKLEITETALMENSDLAAQQLTELRRRGIQVLLDDFGTGYSSLSYLHRFPLDAIKIDATFVASMDKDDRSAAIVRAVVALAHGLGMEVIAEGVETASQLDKLRGMGVQYGQGYLFSRPVDALDAENLVS